MEVSVGEVAEVHGVAGGREGAAGGDDDVRVDELGLDEPRVGPTPELDRPSEVPSALHAVDLVVAIGPVLRLPEVAGPRIETQAEGVADPERVDGIAGAERVVRRDRSVREEPQDLSSHTGGILRELRLMGLAGHDVERAVRAEREVAAIVIAVHGRQPLEDRLQRGRRLIDAEPHDLVASARRVREVDVHPRLAGELRMERDPEQPRLGARHDIEGGDRSRDQLPVQQRADAPRLLLRE
jgi:hypothetical protein